MTLPQVPNLQCFSLRYIEKVKLKPVFLGTASTNVPHFFFFTFRLFSFFFLVPSSPLPPRLPANNGACGDEGGVAWVNR